MWMNAWTLNAECMEREKKKIENNVKGESKNLFQTHSKLHIEPLL